jgi:hypothetical protein
MVANNSSMTEADVLELNLLQRLTEASELEALRESRAELLERKAEIRTLRSKFIEGKHRGYSPTKKQRNSRRSLSRGRGESEDDNYYDSFSSPQLRAVAAPNSSLSRGRAMSRSKSPQHSRQNGNGASGSFYDNNDHNEDSLVGADGSSLQQPSIVNIMEGGVAHIVHNHSPPPPTQTQHSPSPANRSINTNTNTNQRGEERKFFPPSPSAFSGTSATPVNNNMNSTSGVYSNNTGSSPHYNSQQTRQQLSTSQLYSGNSDQQTNQQQQQQQQQQFSPFPRQQPQHPFSATYLTMRSKLLSDLPQSYRNQLPPPLPPSTIDAINSEEVYEDMYRMLSIAFASMENERGDFKAQISNVEHYFSSRGSTAGAIALLSLSRTRRIKMLYCGFFMWVRRTDVLSLQVSVQRGRVARIANGAKHSLSRMFLNLLRKIFTAWRRYVTEFRRGIAFISQKLKDLRVKHVTQHLATRHGKIIRVFYDAWKSFHEVEGKKKSVSRRMLCRMANASLSAGFTAWRDLVMNAVYEENEVERKDALINKYCLRITKSLLAKVILYWANYSKSEKRSKLILSKYLIRIQKSMQLKVMTSWRFYISQRKTYRVAVSRFRFRYDHLSYYKAYGTWVDYVTSRKHMKRFLKRWVITIDEAKVVSAFLTWKRNIEITSGIDEIRMVEGERKKALGLKVVQQILNNTLANALSSWVNYVIDRKRNRALLARFSSRIAHQSIFRALAAWTTFVGTRKRLRLFITRLVGGQDLRLVAAALHKWHRNIYKEDKNRLNALDAAMEERVEKLEKNLREKTEALETLEARNALSESKLNGREIEKKEIAFVKANHLINLWKNKCLFSTFSAWQVSWYLYLS